MPELPTLSISQQHFDHIVAAFPGETMAAKAAAYRSWLTNRLVEHVRMVESYRLDAQAVETKRVALAALEASLPPRVAEPSLPTT